MSTPPRRPRPDDDHLPLVLRELGEAADLFQQVLADQIDLTRSDLAVLSLLEARGPQSAGQLAEATGLTTGAVTGMADRLERAGLARREPDPEDRRRVMVRLVPDRLGRLVKLHQPLHDQLHALEKRFTPAERERIADYVRSAARAFQAEAHRLRGDSPPRPAAPAPDEREAWAPLDGVTQGRLLFASGAARLTLAGDAGAGELFRARFEGKAPRLTVRDGTVAIVYGRFSPFSWKKLGASLSLSPEVPWELELRGGIARLAADLTTLRLTRLELRGGVHSAAVALPHPTGTVAVRLTGGAREVSLRRPAGVEARVRVTGGAAAFVFDAQRLGAVGGTVQLETPGYAGAADRYDFEFTGGASGLEIVTESSDLRRRAPTPAVD
jgi:DNA-binding MarR family transcriptional regulator